MRYLGNILFILFSLIFLTYLSLPNLSFPDPPPGAVQSFEPADSETPDRRGYLTDLSRDEVLDHYSDGYKLSMMGIEIPSYQLIYPPEDAFSLVRDQTRSTHLREIVYPFRESLFVNEFVAKLDKDAISYKGIHYGAKITVSIKRSSLVSRIGVGVLILSAIYILTIQLKVVFLSLWSSVKMLRWPWFWN